MKILKVNILQTLPKWYNELRKFVESKSINTNEFYKIFFYPVISYVH